MGNVMAIDIGIVLISITIFDKRNKIFPKKLVEEGETKSLLNRDNYFDVDMSFYSKEHGGTFHFAHFNIHYFRDFLKSKAFKTIIKFAEESHDAKGEAVLLDNLSKLNMITEPPISPESKCPKRISFDIEEETKDVISEEDNDHEHQSSVGGGFPSLAHLEAIKKKIGVIKNFNGIQLLCTGGYNNNFVELISFLLNVKIYQIHGYLETILSAIDFQNENSNDCFYSLPPKDLKNIYELGVLKSDPKEQIYFSVKENFYPYLLINLRSGASFIRVDSKTEYKRIIGTSIGAGTFIGISKLLWKGNDLTKALFAGIKGDSRRIDMSVGDIYGTNYDKIGLPAEVIASSFGKIKDMTPEEIKKLNKEDISLSLLNMIIFNTLTIANLVAQIENIQNIVLIGHHLRILELEQVAEMGFQILTRGKCKLMFLKYASFLGSLGLLIDHADLDVLYS